MDFALDTEQTLLQESARRYFGDNHPLARARKALPWHDDRQRNLWREMAEMGWMRLLLPESLDGLGLGLVEASLIAEESGRYLLNLPWASTGVLLPLWLAQATAIPEALREAIDAATAGELAIHCVDAAAAHWAYAEQCSTFAVIRQTQNQSTPAAMTLLAADTVSGSAGLDPTLLRGPAPALPKDWSTIDITEQSQAKAQNAYRVTLASQLVGIAQGALDLACTHASERMQFGRPIGSNQAIKHLLANAWMSVDNARLAVRYASAALDNASTDTPFACASAEFLAMESALQVTRNCIQVHGGLGFTWEHDAHLYLKRAQYLSGQLGGASSPLMKIAS